MFFFQVYYLTETYYSIFAISFPGAVPFPHVITSNPPWESNNDRPTYEQLESDLKNIKAEFASYKKDTDKKLDDLAAKNVNLKLQIKELQQKQKVLVENTKYSIPPPQSNNITIPQKKDIVREFMNPFFTESQLTCYLNQKVDKNSGEITLFQKAFKWGDNDIVQALTIKLMSNRLYNWLRKEAKILPLPGRSTLTRHLQNFQIAEGYFWAVHEMLYCLECIH